MADRDPERPAEVREALVRALALDLVGPAPGDAEHAAEVLPQAPSKWYLTGFLAPRGAQVGPALGDPPEPLPGDDDESDEDATEAGVDDGQDPPEEKPARSQRLVFPSSMGLSVLVPAETHTLRVTATWGQYVPAPDFGPRAWRRTPRTATVEVDVGASGAPAPEPLLGATDLKLATIVRAVDPAAGVPGGTRAVSIFLVNEAEVLVPPESDRSFLFQTALQIESEAPFVPRPDLTGHGVASWDDEVADLQYRDVCEHAVGHNVAVEGALAGARVVRTTWLPRADVEKVVPTKVDDVTFGMEALGEAETPADLQRLLANLPDAYGRWIDHQRVQIDPTGALSSARVAVATKLLARADQACGRLRRGLTVLEEPHVFEAFRIANRAMATAARRRVAVEQGKTPAELDPPTWRPFQLAFVLLNLPGLAHPEHPDRDVVDLLFFPTGGGKTEAYLGLAAFAMVYRRLTVPAPRHGGVSVLMRYTLRLLTLDQLGRAAGLVCALEKIREDDSARLGTWPFEIGLWVGRGATPNQMGRKGESSDTTARARTLAYEKQKGRPAPIPLDKCPWCGTPVVAKCFQLHPNADFPTDLKVRCASRDCDFNGGDDANGRRKPTLPIVAVDEPLYRRLPAFLIATVDKLAGLPFIGEAGKLFGLADRFDPVHGYAGWATPSAPGVKLEAPLPPPDLVIQDELHLISGPLGTMVGLYEAALDALCTRDGRRPKIVASTATVRRAPRQIRALFGRPRVEIFPPPGPDPRDSFFAKTVNASEANARQYVGVAALGRNPKVVLLRTYLALLGAAQRAFERSPKAADPYMTLLGYFNALRELGGSRRIVEDEVGARLVRYGERKRVGELEGPFAHRRIAHEPLELTSRVSTSEVARAKGRLDRPFTDTKARVDVALATNMISVGLDITRLGLMVVLGQPKSASEYIQATSRVGRDDKRPGLVVTLLNLHRPRDRSHFERFAAWHASFYRAVEATSVTPFSPRALDRGLVAVVTALVRHLHPEMTQASSAVKLGARRTAVQQVVTLLMERARQHDDALDSAAADALAAEVERLTNEVLDAWAALSTRHASSGSKLQYAEHEVPDGGPALLHDPLSAGTSSFRAARSLRDVEAETGLWVRTPDGLEDADTVEATTGAESGAAGA
jgi:hypothetical protein